MTDLIDDFRWRGLIHQTTDDAGIAGWLAERPRTLYIGFDATSDSLHVGSLMQILTLRRFQQAGHRPIALLGGATSMIGDPSGKSEERNLLSPEALEANIAGIREQLSTFLDFDAGENSARLVNNHEWMSRFSYLEFLRDIGKNFPVNVMLAKDSVRTRLDRQDGGISYTEFSYMLLQAYDFVQLHDEFGCELQWGGSDQWGNITAGIDLARRMRGVQLHGGTSPLLTTVEGTKMGKTESGAIWLAAARTSPYHFYQYWINVDDADAGNCLRMLTELPRERIEALDAARAADPAKRESQGCLAAELTRVVHGEDGLATARRATDIFFGGQIEALNDEQLQEIFADVPSEQLSRSQLDKGLNIIDALHESGLAKTKSDARRFISQGGAYVNNRRVESHEAMLSAVDLASDTMMVLRTGKKRYALLRFADR